MKHTIFILQLILCINAIGQTTSLKPSPTTHEAWTIEYLPYKILVQDAITKFRSSSDEYEKAIDKIEPGDRIILVRSQLEKDLIYQMWYGGGNSFTVITSEMVDWIFGATLQTELLDRDSYFNIGTTEVFETDEPNKTYDYLLNKHTWCNDNIDISLSAWKLKIDKLGHESRVIVRWGNTGIGMPNAQMGVLSAGLFTKNYEIGFHIPSPLPSFTEIVLEENPDYQGLQGGIGGYGRFNYEDYGAEVGFSALPVKNTIFTDSYNTGDLVHLMDYYTIAYTNFSVPERVLKPKYGSVIFRAGAAVYRTMHYEIENKCPNSGQDSLVVSSRGNEYLGGILFRLESAWLYNRDWQKPYVELTIQQLGNESTILEAVFRPVRWLAIPFVFEHAVAEHVWSHPTTLNWGIRLAFDW